MPKCRSQSKTQMLVYTHNGEVELEMRDLDGVIYSLTPEAAEALAASLVMAATNARTQDRPEEN